MINTLNQTNIDRLRQLDAQTELTSLTPEDKILILRAKDANDGDARCLAQALQERFYQ